MTLDNEWETSTGLPLDGETATIVAAEFGYNAQIGSGVVCMNMTFRVDGMDEDIEQSFSCGTGEPSRDGQTLDGAPAKFSSRSNYGRLIDSVRALVDHPGEIIGSPKQAGGWVGTKWTIGTVQVETTNPSKPEAGTKVKDALVFTAFHGKEGKAAGKGKAAKTSTSKAAKPAPESDDDDETAGGDETAGENPAGIDQALWDKLVKLAKASDTHDEFSDTALEMKAVDADAKAQKAVISTKAGSVWHAVHGDD